jgi:fibronectin-binding autotransporter adhesin
MATRFYLPLSGAAAVSPSYSNQAWGDTTIAARHAAVTTRINSTMTDVEFPDDNDDTDKDILFRQYVSDPITAQTISAQTLKFQIRGYEAFSVNNMYASIAVYVVSNDGSTVRGTVLSLTRDNTEFTYYMENRQFSATTTQVVSQSGDRIVIEVGAGGDPNRNQDHACFLSLGDDSSTDLPENDTETLAYNPWVEFANTLTFATGAVTGSATLSGTGTLTGAGIAISTATATLSGTGTLTAAGDKVTAIVTGSVSMSGTGTLTAAGTFFSIETGTVTLAGTGTLAGIGLAISSGTATLAGAGTLAGIGIGISFGTATITGTGTLTAAGSIIEAAQTGSATITGAGDISATGSQLTTEVVIGDNNNGYISALPGEYGRVIANMTDTQDVLLTYDLQFSDTGGAYLHRVFLRSSGDWADADKPTTGVEFAIDNVNGTINVYSITSGSRSGSQANGTYTNDTALKNVKIEVSGTTARIKIWDDGGAEPGTWAATWTSAPTISGTLQLGLWSTTDWHRITLDNVLAAAPAVTGTVTMAGTGALTASAIAITSAAATLTGTGTLSASGDRVPLIFTGTTTLSGAGALTATSYAITSGATTLSGTGTLAAAGVALSYGTATLSGTGTLTAAGDIATAIETGSVTLTGAGVLTGVGIAISSSTVTMAGTGTLTASGVGIASGTATLTGAGTLTAYGTVPAGIETGTATLTGLGTITAASVAISFGTATLAGTGALTASSLAITTGTASMAGIGTLTAVGQGAYPFPFFDDFTGIDGDPLDSTKWVQAVT